jgi:hypothetical protein
VQEAEDLEFKPQYLKREKLAFYSPTETEKQRFCVEYRWFVAGTNAQVFSFREVIESPALWQ